MRAALALVTARLALKTMPFASARAAINRGQALMRRPVPPPPAERIVWAVETAGRLIPGLHNCLVQAVAAEAMLTGAGHPCELRIGVAKSVPGQLTAHAWLEGGGKILIGEFELDRYQALAAIGRQL